MKFCIIFFLEVYEQNKINLDYCSFAYLTHNVTSQHNVELLNYLIKLNLEPYNLIKTFQLFLIFLLV